MIHHVKESRRIGKYEVQVVWDEHPSHPDEGSEDAFLVGLDHRNFYVPRNGWSEQSDFREFIRPDNRENDHNELLSGARPTTKPVEGDEVYRRVYIEACENEMEVLAASCGAPLGFTDYDARIAAENNLGMRLEVWEAWVEFDAAHSKWGCWVADVRDYGGGSMAIHLGDIYEGGEKDRWGDPKEPNGYVLVRKDVGWHHSLEEVAKAIVEGWRKYLDGEIVGYRVVEVDEDGEEVDEVDSCWGFDDEAYCMSEGVSIAEALIEQERVNGLRHSHHHAETPQGDLGSSGSTSPDGPESAVQLG